MGHNAEIFLRQNFSENYERVMQVLWDNYALHSFLKNPYDTFLDVGETQAKQEPFSKYFTLFINDENVSDDFLELMKLL